jgi:hypothetical protein
MSKASELSKRCAEALGFKGRFALLAFGVLGLFFPGLVTYLLLSGIAKGLKNVDIQQMLEELEDDA